MACSSKAEHPPVKRTNAGSNPAVPASRWEIPWAERRPCKTDVRGSTPRSSTNARGVSLIGVKHRIVDPIDAGSSPTRLATLQHILTGHNSAWPESRAWNADAVGSNPTAQTNTQETRMAGALIRFEPGEAQKGVRVRSSPSPLSFNGEHSLTAKPHAVTVTDTGSNPVVHPKNH